MGHRGGVAGADQLNIAADIGEARVNEALGDGLLAVVLGSLAEEEVADDHGDPEVLLKSLNTAEADTAKIRDQLKAILAEALAR